MKLFYSIISQKGQPQGDSMFSLGGFCSSTQVSSSQLNSLFGNITQITIERNQPQYVCIILKNTFLTTVVSPILWIESELTNQGKYRIGISESIQGEFESVENIFSRPLYAEFEDVTGLENALELPSLESGKELAIWIERRVDTENEEIKHRQDADYLFSKFPQQLESLETLNLKIKWE
jgi:hypothetical protein